MPSNLHIKHINQDAVKDLTIIFLHEGLGCTEMWGDFPSILCTELGVKGLSYDRYGYGKSKGKLLNRKSDYLHLATKDLHKIIKSLNGDIILYGHSDGGSIALLYASIYPNKIKKIITEAAHVFVEEITIKGIKKAELAFKENKLLKLEKYHGEKFQNIFNSWANTWLSSEFKGWDISTNIRQIECPQLIIQGILDQYGSLKQVETIKNLTKGMSFVFTPICGHAPFKEVPKDVISSIKSFL